MSKTATDLLREIYDDVIQGAIPNPEDTWFEGARTALAAPVPRNATLYNPGDVAFSVQRCADGADALPPELTSTARPASTAAEEATSVPVKAGEYPPLVCDYCGALTPDPWHSSGMMNGKMSKHIHSCDACAARGQKQRGKMKKEQLDTLRLVSIMELSGALPGSVTLQAAAEIRRMHAEKDSLSAAFDRLKFALNEWHEKTDWVQKSAQPKELGKHLADVLRERIEALQSEKESLHAALVKESIRAANEKLRAEKMALQHRMIISACKELASPRAAAYKPLADEQIEKLCAEIGFTSWPEWDGGTFQEMWMQLARAIEAAHGITAAQKVNNA